MPLSLHAAFVPTCLQILGSTKAIVEKAKVFCEEAGLAQEQLIFARLAEDMLPFNYQVKSTVVHSVSAIKSLERGVFLPDTNRPPETFELLSSMLDKAVEDLTKLTEGDLEKYIGKEMSFEFKEFKVPFTAENFLLSFSQPNFFFHATTAYDILRENGLKIGKIDFMGEMRKAQN